eukprot:NODE_26240_length_558_cov_2.800464.p2 GENE.NODE_26240_length_558_cov_2.800464~~NODE_26240_length_558_cov_2.800464.p2  ORF type:complete len:148 (+),score=42.23 NODE_26240_length_558_cov_2.800464:95-538(+)
MHGVACGEREQLDAWMLEATGSGIDWDPVLAKLFSCHAELTADAVIGVRQLGFARGVGEEEQRRLRCAVQRAAAGVAAHVVTLPYDHRWRALVSMALTEPTRLRRISYAVFCLKKKKNKTRKRTNKTHKLTTHGMTPKTIQTPSNSL